MERRAFNGGSSIEVDIRLFQKLCHYLDMAVASGKVESCPLVKTPGIKVNHFVLHLFLAQEHFYFIEVAFLRCVDISEVVFLFLLPPVAPS